jgi:hypothetical protein
MQQIAVPFSATVTAGGECREWRPPPVVHDSWDTVHNSVSLP